MWVPLAIKNRIIGGIGVAYAGQDYFTGHHADLALTVANQAAITMVNAELYEQAHAWLPFKNDSVWRETCTMRSTSRFSPPA